MNIIKCLPFTICYELPNPTQRKILTIKGVEWTPSRVFWAHSPGIEIRSRRNYVTPRDHVCSRVSMHVYIYMNIYLYTYIRTYLRTFQVLYYNMLCNVFMAHPQTLFHIFLNIWLKILLKLLHDKLIAFVFREKIGFGKFAFMYFYHFLQYIKFEIESKFHRW